MKKEAVSHTKMGRLMRKLKLRRFQAVGLCEMLWHTTAREAPAGDIGKLSDEDIAIALDWNRDSSELIGGFVHAGLVDLDLSKRLIIHDWPEHAEDSVHSKLCRSKQFFCDGKPPKITGLRKSEAEAATAFYSQNPVATPVQPVANPLPTPVQPVANPLATHNPALPCPTLPNPTQPCQGNPLAPDGAGDSPSAIADVEPEPPKLELVKQPTPFQAAKKEIALRIWERHPHGYRSDLEVVERRLGERVKDLQAPEEKIKRMQEIDTRHARWCVSEQWAGKGMVNNLGNWFTKGFCMQEPPDKRPDSGGSQQLFQMMAENIKESGNPFK